MCGINGIFHFSESQKREGELLKMNQVLAHRGPDAEGVFETRVVELGHRRLSIIDVSAGANQPMKSSDGNLVIVFNGELYNFQYLKSLLKEYSFTTVSDTEVVLAAYQKWGVKAFDFFNGIYAFAIFDTRKNELIIVRDRLGVKPLYYYSDNDAFVFSSSVKSILSTDRTARKISKSGLIDFLRYQTVHAPATLLEDVFMLMPGHFVKVNEEEGVVFEKYYSPTKIREGKPPRTMDEAKSLVRGQLQKSVEMQLVSDVPFGAFLSGGIDSSILVGLMSQARNTAADTFSVVFKEDAFSERDYAKQIATKFKTNHHEIELSVSEFKELIPDALAFMDHPSGDGPNTFVIAKKTREAGIKMALSGLGGDELFGGYSVFSQLPELYSKKWLRSFPAYARRPFARLYRNLKSSVAADKKSALLSLEEFDVEDIYPYYRQVFLDHQVIRLLNFQLLTPNASREIARAHIGYKKSGWGLSLSSKISVAEMTTYMQNVLLRDSDQMSMAHGLELRVPFLDHELVELALSIDDQFKKPGKKLLIESFSDILPPEIYNRPKMGFVLPYDVWMKNELKEFCLSRLQWLKQTSYFSETELDSLWSQFLNNSKRITWSRIWILVVLSNWMQQNNVR